MASESDVENTLVSLIVGWLYPNGTSQPSAAGVPVAVFRGTPTTQQQELAKSQSAPGLPGLVNVSITAHSGVERNTSRVPLSNSITVTPPVHTLTATVGGTQQNQITIGGTVATPQNVMAIIGGSAQNQAFSYAVQATDTLNSVAAGLAAQINASYPGTTSTGAVVNVASTLPVKARVAAAGTVLQIVGQSEKPFHISIWAPPCNVAGQDPDHWRSKVTSIIDPQLRALPRIVLPDQTYGHMHYHRTLTMSAAQTEGLYRRDLHYWVEHAITISSTAYEIGIATSQLQSGFDAIPLPATDPKLTNNS